MKLDAADIDRIAQRVAALLTEGAAVAQPARYVDAAALARSLGVERSWVYAHAVELGAIRLGGGHGRLRFDLEAVMRRLRDSPNPAPLPRRAKPVSRRHAVGAPVTSSHTTADGRSVEARD